MKYMIMEENVTDYEIKAKSTEKRILFFLTAQKCIKIFDRYHTKCTRFNIINSERLKIDLWKNPAI